MRKLLLAGLLIILPALSQAQVCVTKEETWAFRTQDTFTAMIVGKIKSNQLKALIAEDEVLVLRAGVKIIKLDNGRNLGIKGRVSGTNQVFIFPTTHLKCD